MSTSGTRFWRRELKRPAGLSLRLLLIGPWIGFTFFVFIWILFGSLRTTDELFSNLWAFPSRLHLENYVSAWQSSDLATNARNSTIVVASATFLTVAMASLAAYALSRIKFPGAGFLTTFFAVGIGIPVQVVLIPIFIILARVGLTNSLIGLALIYISASLPFSVFLLTGYFRSLPYELEEAAAIDGASPLTTFLRIMLPLAGPGLITAVMLNVVGLWNEFFLALTLLNDNSKYTLPLGIVNLYGNLKFTGNWAGMFAGVIIVVTPVTAAYLWLSNRIIEGLTLGTGR